MNYNRWDNFEGFTPGVAYAHRQLLHGSFPSWNPHQFMGEPLHAQTQNGVLYTPYTIAVAISGAAGLPDERIPLVILLLHLPFAGLGWFLLHRRLGVRPSLAFVASCSMTGGGYLTAIASVWMFSVPVFTWMPFILLSVVGLLGGESRPRDGVLLAVSLTAVAFVGYTQLMLHCWIMAGAFGLLHVLLVARDPRRLLRLGVPLVSAALMSAPVIVPTLHLLGFTSRSEKMSLDQFLERSLHPQALGGLLLPLLDVQDGFFGLRSSLMLFQGTWLVPALVLAGGLLLAERFRRTSPGGSVGEATGPEIADLGRVLLVSVSVTALFVLFALGANTPLYPMTHGIPVWSSLRWPFKFLLAANALVGLSAGLALEMCARLVTGVRRKELALGAGAFLAGVAVALLVRFPSALTSTAAAKVCLAAGLPLMVLTGVAGLRWARHAFVVLAIVETVGVVALGHGLGFKTYDERLGAYGPDVLGIDARYRVLPLTVPEWQGERPAIQELGLLFSPTVNGYDGVTGCEWGMTLSWVGRRLPASVFGTLPPDRAAELIDSHLLRSFNTRYVIVGKNDLPSRRVLERAAGYRLAKELDRALVYDNGSVLPRAYFASHLFAYREREFVDGMLRNSAPPGSAYVESLPATARPGPLPPSRVADAVWRSDRVDLRVDAPEGGVLVVSMASFPEWAASIDGRAAPLYRANGAIQAVLVPPHSKEVTLVFRPASLHLGLALAALGAALLAGVEWSARRSKWPPSGSLREP
jgi:hypothetical protein